MGSDRLQAIGAPFRDFVVVEESERGLPGWVNLVGIESPGLTCCLELAREVRELLAPAPEDVRGPEPEEEEREGEAEEGVRAHVRRIPATPSRIPGAAA